MDVQFGVGLPFHGYVTLRVNDTPDGGGAAPVGSFEWEGTRSLNGMPGSQVSVSQFDSDAAWTP